MPATYVWNMSVPWASASVSGVNPMSASFTNMVNGTATVPVGSGVSFAPLSGYTVSAFSLTSSGIGGAPSSPFSGSDPLSLVPVVGQVPSFAAVNPGTYQLTFLATLTSGGVTKKFSDDPEMFVGGTGGGGTGGGDDQDEDS